MREDGVVLVIGKVETVVIFKGGMNPNRARPVFHAAAGEVFGMAACAHIGKDDGQRFARKVGLFQALQVAREDAVGVGIVQPQLFLGFGEGLHIGMRAILRRGNLHAATVQALPVPQKSQPAPDRFDVNTVIGLHYLSLLRKSTVNTPHPLPHFHRQRKRLFAYSIASSTLTSKKRRI